MPDALTQHWRNASSRERAVLIVGAIVVAAMLGWALLWLPATDRIEAAERRIGSQQQTLARLQQLAALQRMRPAGPSANHAGSPASRADRGLRMAGLAAAIRRIEPAGDGRIRITLEGASFDDLVEWLADAPGQDGLVTSELDVRATERSGAVDARLEVADAASG